MGLVNVHDSGFARAALHGSRRHLPLPARPQSKQSAGRKRAKRGAVCIFLLWPMSNTLSFSNSTLLQLITITKNDGSARRAAGYRRPYAPISVQTNRSNTSTLVRAASGDKRKTKIRKPSENSRVHRCLRSNSVRCAASPSHFGIESRTEYARALSLQDISALKSLSY